MIKMGKRIQKYKTYFSINSVESGIASWNNYSQIKKWGKAHGYESFSKDGRLYLVNEEQIIVYLMMPKDKMIEDLDVLLFNKSEDSKSN